MFSGFLTAMTETLGKLFEWRTCTLEHESETEIIKDKQDYKKATNIAEKIIKIAQCYKPEMSFIHRIEFSRYVEQFKKYN